MQLPSSGSDHGNVISYEGTRGGMWDGEDEEAKTSVALSRQSSTAHEAIVLFANLLYVLSSL
jgi:hypothetical protein